MARLSQKAERNPFRRKLAEHALMLVTCDRAEQPSDEDAMPQDGDCERGARYNAVPPKPPA
jgi:hypothetical protein